MMIWILCHLICQLHLPHLMHLHLHLLHLIYLHLHLPLLHLHLLHSHHHHLLSIHSSLIVHLHLQVLLTGIHNPVHHHLRRELKLFLNLNLNGLVLIGDPNQDHLLVDGIGTSILS